MEFRPQIPSKARPPLPPNLEKAGRSSSAINKVDEKKVHEKKEEEEVEGEKDDSTQVRLGDFLVTEEWARAKNSKAQWVPVYDGEIDGQWRAEASYGCVPRFQLIVNSSCNFMLFVILD